MRGSLLFLCAALIALSAPALAQTPAVKTVADLESAGLMRDIAAGAFEKTLWRDNERSEINKGIEAMPPESALRSLHDLKRRVLLSQSDATLIDNDVSATDTDNLFIRRIVKLQQMGLYEEALKLYTDNIDTPANARTAELGLILIAHQRGLATACLEEKVLAPEFDGDAFFTQMDSMCSFALGQTDTPPDLESVLLKALLKQDSYKLSASDLATFKHVSPLEMAVLKSEGRIDYTTFDTTPAALKTYPARVLMTFLEDKTLPAPRLLPLQTEMARRGYVSVKKLPVWKEAHILKVDVNDKKKTDESAANAIFWKAFTPILSRETEIVNLTPYGQTLSEMGPRVEGKLFYKALAVILASGNEVSPAWCDAAKAQKGDQAAVYYQTLTFLQACAPSGDKAVDNLANAAAVFPPTQHANLWIIMGLLSPQTDDYASIKQIYEKHLPLTAAYDYVMHTQAEEDDSSKGDDSQGFGVALLRTLSIVKSETGENMNPPALQITVKRLLDEGLDSDARQLAKEVFVGLLQQ